MNGPNKVQQKLIDQAPWLRELRQRVRDNPCPKCGAVSGQKCIGVRVQARYRNHRERWQLMPDCPPLLKGKSVNFQPPDVFDRQDAEDLDDSDGIQCRRCGATGLYWQTVIAANGEEKHVLYDGATKRRHMCGIGSEAFDEVPE